MEIFENLKRVIDVMVTQDSTMMIALSNWAQRKGELGGGVGDGDDLPEELLRQIVLPQGFSLRDLDLGMVVISVIGDFDYNLGVLKKYKEEFGDVLVPMRFEYHGVKLRNFVSTQRMDKKKGRLSMYKEERLGDLGGFVWDIEEYEWNNMCALFERYVAEHGNANVPQGTKYDGKNLGMWVGVQRRSMKAGKMSQEHKARLDACGIS